MDRSFGRLAALVFCILAAAPAWGQQIFRTNSIFSAQKLSVWNSGPAFALDTGSQFLGEQWNVGDTVGGIDTVCVVFACAKIGAEIGAQTTGKLGLDYALKVNSGSFDVLYPGVSSITVPSAVPVMVGGLPGVVTLGTQFGGVASLPTNSSGGVAASTLQVTGPTLQASVRLEAQASAFAGATVCVVVGCVGPAFGPYNFDGSQDLLKINPNNDGSLTVLGTTVNANQNVSALGGLVNASIRLPNLDSSSAATAGGVSGGVLTSATRDNIAAVNANLAQIAADLVGLPIPLAGNIGPFGYNLLESNAGLALDVSQSLQLAPAASGKLLFSAPVTPIVNGLAGPLSTEIDFKYGDTVNFLPGALKSVSFTPVTDLAGKLHNDTSLVVSGNINVKALGLDIAGLSIGPLIDASLPPADIGSIGLVNQSFTDHLDTIAGQPITIDFSCGTVTGGGEFKYLGICASSKFVDLGPAITVQGVSIDRYNREDCASYSYQIGFTDPGSSCTSVFDHFGSPYLSTPLGKIDVSGLLPLLFSALTPDASSTDASDAALLGLLGYVPGAPVFDIPPGATFESFEMPEPASAALLLAPLIGTMARRRRISRSR